MSSNTLSLKEFHIHAAKIRLRIQYSDETKLSNTVYAKTATNDETEINSFSKCKSEDNITEEHIKSNEWESLKSKLILDNTILQRENLNLKQKNETLIKNLFEYKETINQLKEDLKREKHNTEKINIEYNNKLNEMKTMERNIKLLGSEHGILSSQFENVQQLCENLKSKNQELLKSHQHSLEVIINKNRDIDLLKNIICDKNINEKKLEEDILQQTIHYNILQSESSSSILRSQINTLKKQNDSQKVRIHSQQEQINAYITEIDSLKNHRKESQDVEMIATESVQVIKNAETLLIQGYENSIKMKNEEIVKLKDLVENLNNELKSNFIMNSISVETVNDTLNQAMVIATGNYNNSILTKTTSFDNNLSVETVMKNATVGNKDKNKNLPSTDSIDALTINRGDTANYIPSCSNIDTIVPVAVDTNIVTVTASTATSTNNATTESKVIAEKSSSLPLRVPYHQTPLLQTQSTLSQAVDSVNRNKINNNNIDVNYETIGNMATPPAGMSVNNKRGHHTVDSNISSQQNDDFLSSQFSVQECKQRRITDLYPHTGEATKITYPDRSASQLCDTKKESIIEPVTLQKFPQTSVIPPKSDVCPSCRDQAYGLMVSCCVCGSQYHSGCVRKLRKSVNEATMMNSAGLSNGNPDYN